MMETELEFSMNQDSSQKSSPVATYVLMFVLVILVFLTGYNYFFKPFAQLPEDLVVQVTPSPTPAVVELDYRNMVETMTAEEKIAQLIAAPVNLDAFVASDSAVATASAFVPSDASASLIDFIAGGGVVPEKEAAWGSVILFGINAGYEDTLAAITALKASDEELPPLILVDHEGGTVQRLSGDGFTKLPSWKEACTLTSEERGELWQRSADELQKVGVDLVLAPMLDISANHPVLKTRVCSDDPETIAVAAGEFVATFNAFGVNAAIKHFPGIGQTKKDLHKAFDTVTVTEDDVELYKLMLTAYPTTAVMVSHVGVVNQDETLPCSLSASCVGQIHELFPGTLLISDALNMKATGVNETTQPLALTAQKALEAGVTVLLFEPGVSEADLRQIQDQLVMTYEGSYEFREQVNSAVELLLRYKLEKAT